MIEPWGRHDLLHVDPYGFPPDMPKHAVDWVKRGWPVIVRRYLPTDAATLIPVAISLPGKPRNIGVAFQISPAQVICRAAAVTVGATQHFAPQAWQGTLAALHQLGERSGSVPTVFGSLLWQTLTRMSYLKTRSDLDLIWRVADHRQAVSLAQSIAGCAATSPVRIDGEFVLPDDSAVQWREFHDCAGEVLTKTLHGVQSRPMSSLFATA
jgi:phosphoribosyl-dephospho-CoA transferase